MDISATYRNPEPGDNPLLFSTDSKGSFRCTQPQTVMHTTKPLLNQFGTTGPHRSNQPTQDSNPGPSDHESQTLCVSPPSEDGYFRVGNGGRGREIPVYRRIMCVIALILWHFVWPPQLNSQREYNIINSSHAKAITIVHNNKALLYKLLHVMIYYLLWRWETGKGGINE